MSYVPTLFDDASLKLIVFMDEYSLDKSAWYAGITNDPDKCLYEEHNLDRKIKNHLVIRCHNNEEAKLLAGYLLNEFGCKGEFQSDSDNEDCVYIYVFCSEEPEIRNPKSEIKGQLLD